MHTNRATSPIPGGEFGGTELLGIRGAGPAILSRTAPTLLVLGVALAAGGAAAFAHARRGIANSIAGVAIAVALVPPLAACGIGLAIGSRAVSDTGISLSEFERWSGAPGIAAESYLHFLTNLVGIVVVSVLVFAGLRYVRWKHVLAALPIVIAFSVSEIRSLDMALREVWVENRALRLAVKLTEDRPDLITGREKIHSIGVYFLDDVLRVFIEGSVPRDLLSSEAQRTGRVDRIRQLLSEDLGQPVVVEVGLVPVDIVRLRSEPQELLPDP